MDPSFKPTVKINAQKIYSSSDDHKHCIWPVAKNELYAGERGGTILKVSLLDDGGCNQAVVYDNNYGTPVTDIIKDNTGQVYFVDTDRLQLKQSIAKFSAKVILQNVNGDVANRGKILKLFLKKNWLYVLGNEANTIIVYNQGSDRIETEVTITEFKKGKSIVDFAINPATGDIIALSSGGDVVFRSLEDSRLDSCYRFTGRENERFKSLHVNWENKWLFTTGTQTVSKQDHKHVIYAYDISHPEKLAYKCKSETWTTHDPQFRDTIVGVFAEKVKESWYVVCFTHATSSVVAFRFDDYYNHIDIASFPQRINKGHISDVKQDFGYLYAAFDNQDLCRITLS